MRAWSSLVAVLASLAACGNSAESPVPKEPPSAVARLAAQACGCTSLECLRTFKSQLDGMIASQHQSGNAARDNAEAKAKIAQCEARLSPSK